MLPHPPSLQAPPPEAKTMPLAQAEDLVLAAYDEGRPLPEPKVAPADAPALAWLRALAGQGPEGNPFPPGTAAHAEAEAWLAFLKLPPAAQPASLQGLSTTLTGTQLGLWRWGQAAAFAGRLTPAQRRAFEDRLAESPAPGLRGYALRHALCHALAGREEDRFVQLRQRYDFIEEELFRSFQRLFSLLDGPAPALRLHVLPGLAYSDTTLSALGKRRIWMTPAAEGPLPALPPDVAWIVPSLLGAQDPREPRLEGEAGAEASDLDRRFASAGRKAWFAASRKPFEAYGLVHFPILIELDAKGLIRDIRMGDAAPGSPEPTPQPSPAP